jgi:hypothetical protein
MKKRLLLYILLAFLVAMNGFFLFKQFSSSDTNEPQRKGPGNFIPKQLKFNDVQTAQFEKLDAAHHEKIRAILNDIKLSKDALFDQLTKEAINDSEINAITKQIAKKQAVRELETFYFFRAVTALCDEEQKVRFKTIIKDAVRGPGGPGENGPPRRPGGPDGPGGPDRPRGPGDENRPPPPPRR